MTAQPRPNRALSAEQKQAAAREAGARGRTAQPMGHTDRLANYLQQNGPNKSSAPELTHLTPAQRRRLDHKLGSRKQSAIRRKRKAA